MFEEGTLFAPTPSDSAFKIGVATAAYLGLRLAGFDVTVCYHENKWHDTINPRKVAILLDSIASGTGKEEYISIDVNLYGFRDVPRTWSDKIDQTLAIDLHYVQSCTAIKLFIKRRGNGITIVGVQTDDGLPAYSDNDDGKSLLHELFAHLNKVNTITAKSEAKEYGGVQITKNSN